MATPTSQDELISASQEQFDQLISSVSESSKEILTKPGACENWSIKDILAHLHAWHLLFLRWYREGMSGEKPEMPDSGYSWKETPALNEKIYQTHKGIPLDKILELLQQSHDKLMAVIQSHSDEELFTKKFYGWTGSSSLGVYIRGASSSHYDWANKLVKKFLRSVV